jgi:hypothetical protein
MTDSETITALKLVRNANNAGIGNKLTAHTSGPSAAILNDNRQKK